MTKQIERAYRRNRRTSWLLLAALVVIAAIAIPLASGAPSKYYTLARTAPSTGDICFGQSATVVLRLTNKTNPQTLGSADITLPGIVTATGAATATTGSVSRSGNTISLRDLNLAPKTGYVDVTVNVTGGALGKDNAITAIVKQANDFNDSGGNANVFLLQGAFPTLSVVNCVGTIAGHIWRDSNESRTQDGTEANQGNWNVYLYKSGTNAPTVVQTDSNGDYIFKGVPLNYSYVVCEGDPAKGSWAQSTPTTASTVCSENGHEDAGHAFAFTSSPVTGKDFGNVNTVGVDCAGSSGSLQFTTSTADSKYTVKIAGGSLCGKNAEFVFETYATGATERVANLHPVDPDATGTIHVLEKMDWIFAGSGQPDPANRSLKYDDEAPYNPVPMPYCLKDPRSGVFDLDPNKLTGVLPAGHTSCLITTTETAASASGGTRVDIAYTNVDGYRAFP